MEEIIKVFFEEENIVFCPELIEFNDFDVDIYSENEQLDTEFNMIIVIYPTQRITQLTI